MSEVIDQVFQTQWNAAYCEKEDLSQAECGHGRTEQRTTYVIDAEMNEALGKSGHTLRHSSQSIEKEASQRKDVDL